MLPSAGIGQPLPSGRHCATDGRSVIWPSGMLSQQFRSRRPIWCWLLQPGSRRALLLRPPLGVGDSFNLKTSGSERRDGSRTCMRAPALAIGRKRKVLPLSSRSLRRSRSSRRLSLPSFPKACQSRGWTRFSTSWPRRRRRRRRPGPFLCRRLPVHPRDGTCCSPYGWHICLSG